MHHGDMPSAGIRPSHRRLKQTSLKLLRTKQRQQLIMEAELANMEAELANMEAEWEARHRKLEAHFQMQREAMQSTQHELEERCRRLRLELHTTADRAAVSSKKPPTWTRHPARASQSSAAHHRFSQSTMYTSTHHFSPAQTEVARPGCPITKEQIEQSHCRDPQSSVDFPSVKFSHKRDFASMKLVNLETKERERPKRALYSFIHFSFICDDLPLNVPSHWDSINTGQICQLISLNPKKFEYNKVLRLYARTMPRETVRSIQRVQNLDLLELFIRKKVLLRKAKPDVDLEEKLLFHGTANSNIEAICTYNFNSRRSGSNGDVYGKGTYFARDASYSRKFCHSSTLRSHGLAPPVFQSHPHKLMILARVLVGEYTLGRSQYSRPPYKNASISSSYDSCVDDVLNPKIFVIFDNNQIYPEYIIQFE